MANIRIKMNLDNDQFNLQPTHLNDEIKNTINNTLNDMVLNKDVVKKIRDTNGNSVGIITFLK